MIFHQIGIVSFLPLLSHKGDFDRDSPRRCLVAEESAETGILQDRYIWEIGTMKKSQVVSSI